MKKRIISFVLIFAITAIFFSSGMVSITVFATDDDFVINNYGQLTEYNGSGGDVVIPDGVTEIIWYCFYGCESVTSVTIPSSVESIGDEAFSRCTNLTSVTIPNSVKEIGYMAFAHCNKLLEINVASDNIDYSSEDGILYDKNKTTLIQSPGSKKGNVMIPSSVKSIGDEAFSWCTDLTSVTIPNSVKEVGYMAFTYCDNLSEINVASDNNDYSSEDGILYDKNKTTLIQCPGGKTGNITIPSSVTFLDYYAFYGCNNLTDINIANGNIDFSCQDGIIYNDDKTTLIRCPGKKSGNVIIPDSVISISDHAFEGCKNLINVMIPNSVTSISDAAFADCKNLISVIIPNSVESIGNQAFKGCENLVSVTIPNSVTSIGLFDIGSKVFYECDALRNIYYTGSQEEWKNTLTAYDMKTGYYQKNIGLNKNVTIHYNYVVPVEEALTGDLNGDTKVNGKDATRLMQYLAGWDVEIDQSAADVNGDGKVNGKDATRLMQYLAGWDVTLGK